MMANNQKHNIATIDLSMTSSGSQKATDSSIISLLSKDMERQQQLLVN